MRKFGLWAVLVLLWGCSDSQTDEGGAVTPIPDDPTVRTCETMTCPHGCCDGVCVDLRSDAEHCGRCETTCDKNWFCIDSVCSQSCSGDNARMCSGQCVSIATNEDHCGRCNRACGDNMTCVNKACLCEDGWSDCDGNALNGCEIHDVSCDCTPGATRQCYTFGSGTPGVGRCRDGVQTCGGSAFWSICEGEEGPLEEIFGNGIDDDCDGQVDEGMDIDADGDGYTPNQGDCCDSRTNCNIARKDTTHDFYVEDPSKINPGAVEDPSNGFDDNCNGIIDEEPVTECSSKPMDFVSDSLLTSQDAVLLAKAMDICTDAEQNHYGLIEAQLLLADGSPLPQSCISSVCGSGTTQISPADQVAVMSDLGGIVKPVKNATFAVLSSGKAEGVENTGTKDCVGTEVKAPAVFLDAHGGKLPASTVCQSERTDTKANDSMMLRLKLKAPSNAQGFSFRFKFFSKEYPGYVCDNYNDFFLALTDARSSEIPVDRNVAFDANRDPVSVNNAFFTECEKDACKKPRGCSSCPDGTSNLLGYFGDTGQCGATGWLETSVPVFPNEIFTLDLVIFDAGESTSGTNSNGYGHQRDSLVLLDGFSWKTESTKLETIIIVN